MCILEINLNVFSDGPVWGKEKMAGLLDIFWLEPWNIWSATYGSGENLRGGEGIH